MTALVTTASLGEQGAQVEPRAVFDGSAKQVVAVAFVGQLARSATITMSWYRLSGVAKRLFVQHIRVRSFDRAYSTAQASSHLAAGLYRVTASVDGDQLSQGFVVGNAPPSGSGETPGAGSPPTASAEDGWGSPPSEGASGTEATAPTSTTPSSTSKIPCATDLIVRADGGDFAPVFITGSVTAGSFSDCGKLFLAAAVAGKPHLFLASGSGNVQDDFSPCELPGGSDRPGTVVEVYGYPAGKPEETKTDSVTIQDDPNAVPFDVIVTDPPSGTKVHAGQRITIWATSTHLKSTIEGLTRTITVVSNTGFRQSVTFSEPPPCRSDSMETAAIKTHYRVPSNPPPVITLTTSSVAFNGRPGQNVDNAAVSELPTGDQWQGTLSVGTTGRSCTTSGTGNMTFVVGAKDAVSGTVTMSVTGTCTAVGHTVPLSESGSGTVTGTAANDQLQVQFSGTHTLADVCAEGLHPVHAQQGAVSDKFTITAPSGDVYSCDLELKCTTCDTGSNTGSDAKGS